ncbi:MAG: hypothetical protein ACREBI_04305 [Nitrosotalea sp.]
MPPTTVLYVDPSAGLPSISIRTLVPLVGLLATYRRSFVGTNAMPPFPAAPTIGAPTVFVE